MSKTGKVNDRCDLCGEGIEDFNHVLVECPTLMDIRTQLPNLPVSHLLGFEGDHSMVGLTKCFLNA